MLCFISMPFAIVTKAVISLSTFAYKHRVIGFEQGGIGAFGEQDHIDELCAFKGIEWYNGIACNIRQHNKQKLIPRVPMVLLMHEHMPQIVNVGT